MPGVFSVASDVPFDLAPPELGVALRNRCSAASAMPVPKTSIHTNHPPESRKDYVRFAREVADMKPKTIPKTVEQTSDRHFYTGIGSLDVRHDVAALFGVKTICHRLATKKEIGPSTIINYGRAGAQRVL